MNNCKVVNFEKEIKRANFKRKIKSKINDAKEFVIRNKE